MPLFGVYRLVLEILGHDKTGGLFKRIAGGLGEIFRFGTAILAAQIFYRISEGIASIARESFEAVAYFQNMQLTLASLSARELVQLSGGVKTVEEVFGKAQEQAAGLMDELSDFAILSPFTVEATMNAYKMAMAFGFTTKEAMSFTRSTLTYAAGIGATNDMLDRMAYNLAQVRLQNKVTALDVRQLAMAGFDLTAVLKFAAKQVGENIETHLDFNELLASGKITWEDFIKSYEEYTEQNFAGAAERMSRTLQGLKSTMSDVFVLSMPKILGPAAESITTFVNKILNKFIELRNSGKLEELGQRIKGVVDKIIKALDLLFFHKGAGDFMERMRKALQIVFGAEQGTKIHNFIQGVLSVFRTVGRVGGQIFGALGRNFGKIFGNLSKFWDEQGGKIQYSLSKITGTVTQGAEGGFAGTIVDLIMTPFVLFSEWIVNNGDMIAEWIDRIANFISETLIPAFTTFTEWIAAHWPEIAAFFAGIKIGGEVILLVLSALAGSGIFATIAGLITAITSPIGLLVIAIGVLAAAWAGNWGGIRDKLNEVWTAIKPTVDKIIEVVGTWLVNAIEDVSTYWTETLQPALETVWDFVQENVIPVFEALYELLYEAIKTAITWVVYWFSEKLMPILEDIWGYITDWFQPIWEDIAGFWNETVIPAIETLWEKLGGVQGILETLAGWLATVRDKFLQWADALRGVKPPESIQRDSPSPMEVALSNVLSYMTEINRETPRMAQNLNRLISPMGDFTAALGPPAESMSIWARDQFSGGVQGPTTVVHEYITVPITIERMDKGYDVDSLSYEVARRISENRSRR